MTATHLNLLNPMERRSASPVRARILLPVIAGFVLCFVLVWCGFVGVQYMLVSSSLSRVRGEIDSHAKEMAAYEALKAKLVGLQAEADQFSYFTHGRIVRGELLRRVAYAIPEGVTLTALALPPPPDQDLKRPLGSKLPPPQGPTQAVERVELRLTGLAQGEQDVFQMMHAFEGASFTGMVSVVKHPKAGQAESPRVLTFRQEAASAVAPSATHRDVLFDIVYDLKPREFTK